MSAKDWKDMLEAAQEGDLELVGFYLEQLHTQFLPGK